jgi:RNA polymerase sigma-70 factor (ECF subfamily)
MMVAMENKLTLLYRWPKGSPVALAAESKDAWGDDDLLEAIAGGDRDAFAHLMNRYLVRMVTLAQRIIFDREQAREIAQEAFIKVWQNAPKWDRDGSATFLTWLRRVVINLSISSRRRAHEQVSLDVIEELQSGLADGFDYIAASEKKRIVRDALEKLPERQRAALALYYFDNLSQTQAAETMVMTASAFDSLIVRARSNLRKSLAEFGFGRKEDLS